MNVQSWTVLKWNHCY